MKMASRQDILISGTEEWNWELFVYLCWESVLGTQENSLLITAHLHIQVENSAGKHSLWLIGFSALWEDGILQHQWSQQKGDWELVCYSEAQAPRLQTWVEILLLHWMDMTLSSYSVFLLNKVRCFPSQHNRLINLSVRKHWPVDCKTPDLFTWLLREGKWVLWVDNETLSWPQVFFSYFLSVIFSAGLTFLIVVRGLKQFWAWHTDMIMISRGRGHILWYAYV